MKETAVDEDDFAAGWEDEVGPAGEADVKMSLMSKEELLKSFTVDERGIITSSTYEGVRSPFVGQPLYVAWYWLNFEPVSGWEDEEDEDGYITLRFEVMGEDAKDFPELERRLGETITIKQEVRYKISEVKEGQPYESLFLK